MRSMASLPWALALFATGCSTIDRREDVAACVQAVEEARLRGHVQALCALGPRPAALPEVTRATVDYLRAELDGLGFELHEETFPVRLGSPMVAVVRPADQPDAEPTELELPAGFGAAGPAAMQARAAELRAQGWEFLSYTSRGPSPVGEGINLIAERRGTRAPHEVVEVSAHYDTVPGSPGAIDNASGVAALLEVARCAVLPCERTLRLCFFGAEEVGLAGSGAHLKALRARGEELVGLINLDCVGCCRPDEPQRYPEGLPWFLFPPERADFLVVLGKASSGWLGNLVEDAIDAHVPELPYYSANRIGSRFPDAYRSDHAHYWYADLPAVFLSDMGEFRSPDYHRPSDGPAKVHAGFLGRVSRATLAAALYLAKPGDAELEKEVPGSTSARALEAGAVASASDPSVGISNSCRPPQP